MTMTTANSFISLAGLSGTPDKGGNPSGNTSIARELNVPVTNEIGLGTADVRRLGGRSSGQINMPHDFYGKSNITVIQWNSGSTRWYARGWSHGGVTPPYAIWIQGVGAWGGGTLYMPCRVPAGVSGNPVMYYNADNVNTVYFTTNPPSYYANTIGGAGIYDTAAITSNIAVGGAACGGTGWTQVGSQGNWGGGQRMSNPATWSVSPGDVFWVCSNFQDHGGDYFVGVDARIGGTIICHTRQIQNGYLTSTT